MIELIQPLPQHKQGDIVNLTKYVLSKVEISQLGFGLEYSFINKSKNQQNLLAANNINLSKSRYRYWLGYAKGIPWVP